MDSADPPLAVHGLYGGRYCQRCRDSTKEVHELGGPLGGGPARLAICYRSVLVRAAVCRQVAQRAKHRLSGLAGGHALLDQQSYGAENNGEPAGSNMDGQEHAPSII